MREGDQVIPTATSVNFLSTAATSRPRTIQATLSVFLGVHRQPEGTRGHRGRGVGQRRDEHRFVELHCKVRSLHDFLCDVPGAVRSNDAHVFYIVFCQSHRQIGQTCDDQREKNERARGDILVLHSHATTHLGRTCPRVQAKRALISFEISLPAITTHVPRNHKKTVPRSRAAGLMKNHTQS